jgi:predicted transcriptional regulator
MNAPTRISAEVDEATLAKIEAAAAMLGVSLERFASDALRQAAEDAAGLTERGAAWRAFVQQGLDSANRGEFVSQEAMEAWFEERVAARQGR